MADESVPGMADAIDARMRSLHLSPTDLERRSGLSSPQCLDVRAGKRKGYAMKTRRGIAQALRWPIDWYDRLVAGDDGAAIETVLWPIIVTPEERLDALEAQMGEVQSALRRLLERLDRPGP